MLQVKIVKSYRDNEMLIVEAQVVETLVNPKTNKSKDYVRLERRLGYPLATTSEIVIEEMAKLLSTYKSDLVAGEKSMSQEKLNAQADKTIASLESLQVIEKE